MKKIMKHIMIHAAITIFALVCGFSAMWNFMYCNDMLVCVILIGYMIIMFLLSDKIDEGLK